MTHAARLALFGCLLLLCACGNLQAYRGLPRDPGEVARLYPHASSNASVVIESVDGYEPGLFDRGVELLPGHHQLQLLLVFEHGDQTRSYHRGISFNAEPGRDYLIVTDLYLHGPRVLVLDDLGGLVAEAVTPAGMRDVGTRRRTR